MSHLSLMVHQSCLCDMLVIASYYVLVGDNKIPKLKVIVFCYKKNNNNNFSFIFKDNLFSGGIISEKNNYFKYHYNVH